MVVIGIDAHKKTFTAVAVDELGRQLGHRTLESTSDGCFQLVRWASQWRDRRFAVEDCRHLTRRLESDLLTAGESLVRVHTQLMAGERRGGRERGKYGPDQGPWKSIEEVELATLSGSTGITPNASTATSVTSHPPKQRRPTTVN